MWGKKSLEGIVYMGPNPGGLITESIQCSMKIQPIIMPSYSLYPIIYPLGVTDCQTYMFMELCVRL